MEDQQKMSNESASKVEGDSGGPRDQVKDLEEEFNMQRAKMKELFLQKEDDLRKLRLEKEQLDSEVLGLRAELQQLQTLSENQKSEIQSLQMLVSETIEASSSGTEEIRRLQAKNLELEQQIQQLRTQQQEVSLVPATFVRNLARKLGADTDLEQPSKKNAEDSELVRSIIEPMEMEIAALKNKLRETDARLQDTLKQYNHDEEDTSRLLRQLSRINRPLGITFPQMTKLMGQCQQVTTRLYDQVEGIEGGAESSREIWSEENEAQARLRAGGAHAGLLGGSPLSLLQGIIPGTKWCGTGDIAADYHDLGADRALDRCCRTHDLCPTKVRAFSRRYNLTNNSLYSKSHCTCDDMLFDCLKSTNTSASNLMGHIYFNLVQVPCIDDQPNIRFREARPGF